MNSFIIDIIFVVFFIFMAIIGYVKGFITRLYDLITTILVIYISFLFASPLSSVVSLYDYDPSDLVSTMIGQSINMFLVFLCIFIVLFIAKKLIGIALKPVLKGIVSRFSLTEGLDKLLGVTLSLIEALFISYIVVLLCITPLFPNAKVMVEDTLITQNVLKLVPSMTQYMEDMTSAIEKIQDGSHSKENLITLMLMAEDLHLLSEEQITTIIDEHIYPEIKNMNITLTQEQVEQMKDILENSSYDQQKIKNIIDKVLVGE
ncbi:MAG: CvpA family protein [Erysipelotrichales bacterium]|nr:CvpA family protein [Erysipelotrichales bacterium]